MPEQSEGLMRGFQLWVNLPAKLKMQAPAYQEHAAAAMPVEKRDGVDVKVIAGATSRGTKGPVTVEPTGALYFDLTLADGATFDEPLDASYAGFVVVHDGAIVFPDGREVATLGLAELGKGDVVRFTAKGAARVLVIAGKPIKEPVAWHGPFVMNTRDEVMQAFADYQAGRIGSIPALPPTFPLPRLRGLTNGRWPARCGCRSPGRPSTWWCSRSRTGASGCFSPTWTPP
jgi:hypothetical protein